MSETGKAHARRVMDGFYNFIDKFPAFERRILDIGFAGTGGETFPGYIVEGLDLNTPGYDGIHIPFDDESFDVVYSSHLLEHVIDDVSHIREQWRVLKKSGFLIIYVPHQFLYEKKFEIPSHFNAEHKRFYTPAVLLQTIEEALNLSEGWKGGFVREWQNIYRVRRCIDCDNGYDYSLPDDIHSVGEYSIEVVLEKLK